MWINNFKYICYLNMSQMGKLDIPGTAKTPAIRSDDSTGFVEIKGRAHPENAKEFFKPLIDWATEYAKNPKEKTTINIDA